jgi:hypothetical protein
MRSIRIALMVLTLPVVAGACYTQVPLSGTPAPGARIIATITDGGVVAMSNAIGPGAQEVEGVIAAATPTSWDLRLLRVDHRGGSSIRWNNEPVTFPRDAFSNIYQKRLSKRRSIVTGALLTVGAFVIAKGFTSLGGEGGNGPGDPLPPSMRRY